MTVVAENHQQAVSKYEDAIYRKITWKLIPFFALCYLASYLDRIHVSRFGLKKYCFWYRRGLICCRLYRFEVPSSQAFNLTNRCIF